MENKYVFLDRDGVINRDGAGRTAYGYVTDWKDFKFLPGVIEGLRALKGEGYKVIVISNQQCVGKGIITGEELTVLTDKMKSAVAEKGGRIDDVFYCTHLKEDNCSCRKPEKGLFIEAQKKWGIDTFAGKYFVGDSEKDIIAGKKAGLRVILVLSGRSSRDDAASWPVKPDHIADDFAHAVSIVTEGI
jgi:D-glycero-D-manno-heptose 1,7-bisphosphate phosphatase